MSVEELQELISSKFDNDTLNKIVQVYSQCDEVNIKKLDISPRSAKGDSYLSVVVRLHIEAEGRRKLKTSGETTWTEVKVPVIVKALPKNIGRRKTFRSVEFFENEVIFYEKVWSELQRFMDSKNMDPPFRIIPLYLSGLADGQNDYIALEDLSSSGYGSASRDFGMDYEHASLILRLFGKFHGIAFAYKQQNPNTYEKVFTSLKETYFSEKQRKWYYNFQNKLISIARDAVEKELPEEYLKIFNNFFKKDFFGLLCKLCEDRGPLSVITHGDSWAPNFLFRYDKHNKPLDAMMIDFQLTRYTTLSNDLTFFFYACTDQELREKHWDDLLFEYHQAFSGTLKQLGTDPKIVSLGQIKAEIKKNGCFGIGMAIEAVTMALLDDGQVSDLDGIQGDKEVPIESVWIVKPLNTPEKRKRLADTLKHAIDNGFLE